VGRRSQERPSGAITGHASGRRRGGNGIAGSALGRHRRARIRASSRPTALGKNALDGHPKERPRSSPWLAGQHVHPAWCRPTSASSRRRSGGKIGAILAAVSGIMRLRSIWCGAADAPGVGRARTTHAMNGQRMIQPRDCCSSTANPCESGIRAPSRGTHPLPGQANARNAFERYPKARIRRSSWRERDRRQRPRTVSRAAHPTAIAPTSAAEERPQRPSQAAPAGAITSGRASRPSGVVPPNQRMQPDAVPASTIAPIVRAIMG
jgi:hypothetical protein